MARNVQVLGLDMWNGSQAQLMAFRSTTRVTFPLLLRAGGLTSLGVNSAGSIDAMMVVDQDGFIRHISGSSTASLNAAAALIDQLTAATRGRIATAETVLAFGQVEPGRASARELVIRNEGNGALGIAEVTSNLQGLAVAPFPPQLAAGDSVRLAISFTPSDTGDLSGELRIASDDADRPVLTVPITATVVRILADARADFDRNGKVDFSDFLAFVQAFGTAQPAYDLDGRGRVDFADFVLFVASYGRPLS